VWKEESVLGPRRNPVFK